MRAVAVARPALRVLWLGAVPALLTCLVLEYLVPGSAWATSGVAGMVSKAAHEHFVLFAMATFLFFAGLVRYWGLSVPGGRHLMPMAGGDRSPEREEGAGLRTLATKRGVDALGLVAIVALAAAIGVEVRARVVAPYRVLSASMLPALEPGDEIAAIKLAYKGRSGSAASPSVPRRGDLIVFPSARVALANTPGVPEFLVKRVIGLPGDRIGMRLGEPTINGWPVPSCDAGEYLYFLQGGAGYRLHGRLRVEFLEDRTYLTVQAPAAQTFTDPYDVRPGEVFVFGDNRNSSLDSRSWNQGRGGGVPVLAIEARAQWFLLGTHRDGEPDMTRAFRSLAGTRLHVEGVDARALEEGVARCLQNRPKDTYPPAPSGTDPMTSSPRGA